MMNSEPQTEIWVTVSIFVWLDRYVNDEFLATHKDLSNSKYLSLSD